MVPWSNQCKDKISLLYFKSYCEHYIAACFFQIRKRIQSWCAEAIREMHIFVEAMNISKINEHTFVPVAKAAAEEHAARF